MKYLDLTRALTEAMPVFSGDPPVRFSSVSRLPRVTAISFGSHSGTHADAPAHMAEGGVPVSELEVSRFFGRGVLLDAKGAQQIGEEALLRKDIRPHDIVLIHTGWQKNFAKDDYFSGHPVLSEKLCSRLVALGVGCLGLDTPSPDREPYPCHRILLGGGVVIFENLCNLEQLLGEENFEVAALPMKLALDGAPARVVAKIL